LGSGSGSLYGALVSVFGFSRCVAARAESADRAAEQMAIFHP
jgi:hypothetical protein